MDFRRRQIQQDEQNHDINYFGYNVDNIEVTKYLGQHNIDSKMKEIPKIISQRVLQLSFTLQVR